MVFESWGTKVGVAVLHGNVKELRAGLFFLLSSCLSVKVKIAQKSRNIAKLHLHNQKKQQ